MEEQEIWVELIEEGCKGKYISNFGNVMCDIGLSFSKCINSDGYYHICITPEMYKHKTYQLHRLIGKYFVSGYSKERCYINHKDGNKINNHYTNLEWVTHQENMQHSVDNGRKTYLLYDNVEYTKDGVPLFGAKLKIAEVKEIKRLLRDTKLKHSEIAKMFNVTRINITQINSGYRWKDVEID